jgi:hypothetical protein
VNEYLELPARVELLNSRFSVLQEMLDMLRDHQVSGWVSWGWGALRGVGKEEWRVGDPC